MNTQSIAGIKTAIRRGEIKQITLLSTDFRGNRKALYLSPYFFLADRPWGKVVGIDGSSYGLRAVHDSDLGLQPDLKTAFMDPIASLPTLSFICNIKEATGHEVAMDPRTILKKAQQFLASLAAGRILCAPELEFYFRQPDPAKRAEIKSWFPPHIASYYHLSAPHDLYLELRSAIVDKLIALGLPVKYHHTEATGNRAGDQHQEIELSFDSPLATADNYAITRYIIENMAASENLIADFNPKPFKNLAGNGLHTHFLARSLKGRSLFYDPKNQFGLSQEALFCIGGILKHGRALAAFTNPTPNSYQRLDPRHEAPDKLFLAMGDRTASIRIPRYGRGQFEYRPTDASGNYYLALAALLLAMADGIQNGLTPTSGRPPRLPRSVDKAGHALENDHDFLLPAFPLEAIHQQIAALML